MPLSVTSEILQSLPIGATLAESSKAEVWDYGRVFLAKATDAEASGDTTVGPAWRLLGQLCLIDLREGDAAEPFGPIAQGPDGRSILPSDLEDETARAVRDLALTIDNPELGARLLDITWCRLRDHDAARKAVQSYVETATRLFDPEHWVGYAERIERALRLARQLEDEALVGLVLDDIERRVVDMNGGDPLYLTVRLMALLHEFRRGEPDAMSRIATKAAHSAQEQRDFERARSHFENLARWRRHAADQDGERVAKIAIAESYVRQAELHSGPGGELATAVCLEQAHEAYRSIPGMRDGAAEVYGHLRQAQRRARESLKQIRTEGIDVSAIVKATREHISGRTFREALFALATVTRPTNFDRETDTARELMEKFPLQGILGGARIDDDGRIVAHRTAAITSDENIAKQVLWERVVEQVSLRYQFAVQAHIVPAIQQLTFEHFPSLRDLTDLVVNNPFVPNDHEELFAKGFLAGLRWSFPEALSILVPQLENSLRHLLARDGAEVTTRDKHGIQGVIHLGTILSDPLARLETILGGDNVKELKALFTDQHGPQLRNRIAHGLVSDSAFFSHSAIYAWWFIFHLCILPVHRRFRGDSSPEGEMAHAAESESANVVARGSDESPSTG
ncbi:MAG: DUF4209 domain-containing protein [Alphaproteobacteria bacterium]